MREIAALLLAGVLVVAGGAKLFDRAGTRRSVGELGLPVALGRPVAIVLPILELALAVGLVVPSTSRAAAAATAALLAFFAAVIGINALRGRSVDCGCFGPLHSSQSGFRAAARNGVLAIVASSLAATAARPVGWRELVAALVMAALVAQAAAWVVLLRRYGRALRQLDSREPVDATTELQIGDAAPTFLLPDLDGRLISLQALLARQRAVLLVFVDAGCAPCRALLPRLADWQRAAAGRLTIGVVGQGDVDGLRSAVEHLPLQLLVSADGAVADDYAVDGTPAALLVRADGTIGSRLRYGAESIQLAVDNGLRQGRAPHDPTSPPEARGASTNALEVAHAH